MKEKLQKIRIGYFADGPWSHNAFNKLIQNNKIEFTFVCLRYDNQDPILKSYCQKYGIRCLVHKNINSDEFITIIKENKADLFVSMSFNQIFKSDILKIPALKSINCHAGKLPFYRGRNILNWVLINDEKEFGITVHYIDEGIDTGDIIHQKTYPINDLDDYNSLLNTAYVECANILYEAILMILKNKHNPIKQFSIHETGSYFPKRKEGDEIINWNQSSRDIFNFIRAISYPGPSSISFINNQKIKINKSELIKNAINYKAINGTIIGIENNNLIVKTSDNFIKITDFEYCGKLKIGDRFND